MPTEVDTQYLKPTTLPSSKPYTIENTPIYARLELQVPKGQGHPAPLAG